MKQASVTQQQNSSRERFTEAQLCLLESFARIYEEQGNLDRSGFDLAFSVKTNVWHALMAAGIDDWQDQEVAAAFIEQIWGDRLVLPEVAPGEAEMLRVGYAEKAGCVYVARNAALPGLLKIGMTTDTAESRLRQLSRSTSIPFPFELVAQFACENPLYIETEIHNALGHARVPGKEFFRVTEEEAIQVCQNIAGGES